MYLKHAKIEEAPLSGETMLFDPEKGRFFVLNRTMAHIWRHCDGRHDFERLLETMRTDFEDADPASLEPELRTALQELLSLGLIVPPDASAAAGSTSHQA